ncbi:unnamed protein product, partial [Meganyctiphanes norvegica]
NCSVRGPWTGRLALGLHFTTCTPTHVSYIISVRVKIRKMLRLGVAKTLMGAVKALEGVQSSTGRILGYSGQNACKYCLTEGTRNLHTTTKMDKEHDRKDMIRSAPTRDEGAFGEATKDIDAPLREFVGMFPDEKTADLLFDGERFADLPIIHVSVSKNNTLMTISNAQGEVKMHRSCGIEGFKNTRKGTNIAAQATAISLATRALDRGIKNVRVTIKGLGPGRISALKGLTMGGINVVSITDRTPISWNCNPRPRAAKTL